MRASLCFIECFHSHFSQRFEALSALIDSCRHRRLKQKSLSKQRVRTSFFGTRAPSFACPTFPDGLLNFFHYQTN